MKTTPLIAAVYCSIFTAIILGLPKLSVQCPPIKVGDVLASRDPFHPDFQVVADIREGYAKLYRCTVVRDGASNYPHGVKLYPNTWLMSSIRARDAWKFYTRVNYSLKVETETFQQYEKKLDVEAEKSFLDSIKGFGITNVSIPANAP